MGKTYETKLPAPGVDIIRTPHVRTFVPGSGGPHLDTLLQNQITLLRQNQDIRTQLALLLGDADAVSIVPGIKKNGKSPVVKLIMSEGLIKAAVKVSRTFHRRRGDGAMKLIRTKTIAYTIRKWREALMKDPRLSKSQKSELDGLHEQHVLALHFYCAAEVRGKVQGETKGGIGNGKEDHGDVEKESVSADDDETECADSGYEEQESPRSGRKLGEQCVD